MSHTATPALDVTVSRVIAADPDTVWAILTDVDRMPELSPETLKVRRLDDAPVAVGSQFKGGNRIGFLRWTTVATVTELDPGRAFAFEISPPSRTHWRYELVAVDGGTRITESMRKDDPQPAPIRAMQRLVGVTDRAEHLRAGMTTTLDRLAVVAEA
jgi:ligand-binding SRPBCC domain-containing protein